MEIKSRFIKAKQNDISIIKQYDKFCIKRFLIYSLISLFYIIIYNVLREQCTPLVYKGFMITFIFINVIVTCIMLTVLFSPTPKLSTNKDASSTFSTIVNFFCLIECIIPIMYILYYIYYDTDKNECSLSILSLFIKSIIVFIVVLIITLILSKPMPYSSNSNKLSPIDLTMMRKDQELAGLDPDKIPIILSSNEIKKMSPIDWNMLGKDLELAGYRVFKSSYKEK